MIETLTQIIDKFGSDKNLSNYNSVYEELFCCIRDVELDVLEIGIGSLAGGISNMNGTRVPNYKQGASLRVWKEWFRYSNIYGMDIQKDCMFEEERIRTFLCDSTNAESVNEVLNELRFNIIIDDGWHNVDAQIKTFTNLWGRLKDGGIYVIEDIENGLSSNIYKHLQSLQIEYNNNQNGNLLWIHKEKK